jgi:hypothetical protein
VRSPAGRIAIVVGTIVVLVGLFALIRRGDGDESASETTAAATTATATTAATAPTTTEATTTTPTTTVNSGPHRIAVVVAGGQVAGGVKTVPVQQNEQILLVVRADVSDEVHVHGYDVMRDVAPGAPAQIALRATIPGRFDVELEDRKLRILELEVRP